MEPLYPFIKSLEEIEYEKRMMKSQQSKIQPKVKRMDLEHFKKEIMGVLESIQENPSNSLKVPQKPSPRSALNLKITTTNLDEN